MAKTTKTLEIEKTALLDKQMKQAFDWSDDKTPVRVAIWNFNMEKNDHDTMKTAEDCKWELTASDNEIEDFCEKNLK